MDKKIWKVVLSVVAVVVASAGVYGIVKGVKKHRAKLVEKQAQKVPDGQDGGSGGGTKVANSGEPLEQKSVSNHVADSTQLKAGSGETDALMGVDTAPNLPTIVTRTITTVDGPKKD